MFLAEMSCFSYIVIKTNSGAMLLSLNKHEFSNDLDKLLYEPKLKEKVVDDLYMIFKEFQNKLDLNP